MGTRGVTGFRIDGVDKIAFQQYDSYPSGVGVQVIEDLHLLLKDRPDAESKVRNLRIVTDADLPTPEVIEKLAPYTDLSVSEQKTEDWFCLLRKTHGHPAKILEAGFVDDASDFLLSSLWCEWGYIINFDENVVEVYKGFQKEKHCKGRYADFIVGEKSYGYFPCALLSVIPFDLIAANVSSAIESMKSIDRDCY